jgi:hypothetical protein
MRLPGEAGGLGTVKTCRVRDVSVADAPVGGPPSTRIGVLLTLSTSGRTKKSMSCSSSCSNPRLCNGSKPV